MDLVFLTHCVTVGVTVTIVTSILLSNVSTKRNCPKTGTELHPLVISDPLQRPPIFL